jgi:hypothetical protein
MMMYPRKPRLIDMFNGDIERALIGERPDALEAKRRLTAAHARMARTDPAEAEMLKRIYKRIRLP